MIATRYLYFVLPLLFVLAAVTLEYVVEIVLADGSVVDGLLGTYSRSALVVPMVVLGLIIVLSFGGGFTVSPQAEYQLGINAPQPEFKGAYAHVNDHREADDVIVAGWTAPGLYYAGGVDYWLAHDLTGTDGTYIIDGKERYAGSKPVYTADELQQVMNSSDRGWIVLDRTAQFRQSDETVAVLDSNTEVVHESERLTVYLWKEHSSQ